MKKLKILFIFILLSVLLASCADSEPRQEDLNMYGSLTYDFVTMSYTNTITDDMFNQMGNLFDDFVILHEDVLHTPLQANDSILFEQLLLKLDTLSKRSNKHMIAIISYTSQELKESFEAHGLVMTLDDIVSFNAIKVIIEDIKKTLDEEKSVITKVDYLSYYTNLELTQQDIEALDQLQIYYFELHLINLSYRLYEHTFEEFIDELELTGLTLNTNQIEQLQNAYDFIDILKTKTILS